MPVYHGLVVTNHGQVAAARLVLFRLPSARLEMLPGVARGRLLLRIHKPVRVKMMVTCIYKIIFGHLRLVD